MGYKRAMRIASPLLAAALVSLAAAPAYAQLNYGGQGPGQSNNLGPSTYGTGRSADTSSKDQDKKADTKPEVPPAAIPGAEPDPGSAVIPSDRVAAEMSPNDALFDAINRGDLSAAKDALNRGAQLDSKNVLGQTPTDAAIDLSRNDITFLLLSMRGAAPSLRHAQGKTAAAIPVAAAPVHGKHGRAVVEANASRRAPARSLSDDRGTPNPEVGFTGF